MRVLPGSHTAARQAALRRIQGVHGWNTTADPNWAAATFGVNGPSLPSHAIEAEPGDAVILNLSLYHAVFGHADNRRLLQTVLSSRPKDDAELVSL